MDLFVCLFASGLRTCGAQPMAAVSPSGRSGRDPSLGSSAALRRENGDLSDVLVNRIILKKMYVGTDFWELPKRYQKGS